ncbi:hypothetical protein [Bradyrhizobium sp. UFLA05-112]
MKLAPSKTNLPIKSTKSTIATKTEKPRPHRVHDRAHLATKKAVVAAKAERPTTPVPPPALATQPEPKSNATIGAGSGTTGLSITDSRPTVDTAQNSKSRTIHEQVAAATAVAERMTVATRTAARDGAEPTVGAFPDDADPLVAVVMVRPEMPSVFALTAKNVAMDDRYTASSADIRFAIVAAGGPVFQLSTGQTAAIDRLVNGEVPAALLALVSPDAAEAFPEIAGFKIYAIPLSSRYLKPRP